MNIITTYKDFEADFMKRNRTLLTLYIVNTLVFSLIVTFLAFKKERFIFTNGKIFKEELLKEAFCAESFKNLTSANPSTYFLTKEIHKLVTDQPFIIDDYETLYLNDDKENSCKIIVKTSSGLKSFIIKLKESSLFPLGYKLSELLELEVDTSIL